jgi:diketogulonate reductase-like aldo/keto reductase
LGYRNIDTAVLYENEEGVGGGIRESGVPRADIFVTTKIPPTVQTYEGAKECIESSIEKLGIGVIDQMLIHSPKPWKELISGSPKHYLKENLAVWEAMEEAVQDGKIRSIGVPNFDTVDLGIIIENGPIKKARKFRGAEF